MDSGATLQGDLAFPVALVNTGAAADAAGGYSNISVDLYDACSQATHSVSVILASSGPIAPGTYPLAGPQSDAGVQAYLHYTENGAGETIPNGGTITLAKVQSGTMSGHTRYEVAGSFQATVYNIDDGGPSTLSGDFDVAGANLCLGH